MRKFTEYALAPVGPLNAPVNYRSLRRAVSIESLCYFDLKQGIGQG